MTEVLEVFRFLQLVVFGSLGLVALLQYRKRGGDQARWVAASFGSLALVVIAARFIPTDSAATWVGVSRRLLVAVLALFPFFLYQFMRSFSPPPRLVNVLATSLTAVVVAGGLALELPASGEPRTPLIQAYVLTLVGQWFLLSSVVAVRLWRAGAQQPTVSRRRMRTLSLGSILMAGALLIGGAAPPTQPIVAVFTQILALCSAPLFLFGFAPPGIVRMLWRRPEGTALRQVEQKLMSAESQAEVAEHLLPQIARLFGGKGALMASTEREVIGSFGFETQEASEIAGALPDSPGVGDFVIAHEGSQLRVPLESGWLVVEASQFSPFFGGEEVDILKSVSVLADLALQRSGIFEREREAVQRLREVGALKDEFVAIVAHDLRSPMAAIGGYADLLRDRWNQLGESERKQFLETISSNAQALARLVEDVLQVAHIESGEFAYSPRAFDLLALVERTVEEVKAGKPGREIRIVAPRHLSAAYGDEDRYWQVISNLLSNALKFSTPDQLVIVEVSEQDQLQVSIKDFGRGIARESHHLLFQKFSRIGRREPGQPKGTGLGLFICKSMVEAQGGRLWVASELGQGATFSFTIPTLTSQ